MRNVVAYCRSAWEPQGGLSAVSRQARDLRQYAKEKGLAIQSIYMDPAVSGSSLDRPDLQRLIAGCRAGQVGTIITQDPERLSRDAIQLIALLHIFETTGVRVEFGTPEGRTHLASLKVYPAALLELEEAKAITDA
jgi:DNA invertase Pin-like site-specific DNA recombinase